MPRVSDTARPSGPAPGSTTSPTDAFEVLRTFLAEHGGGTPVDYSETRVQSAATLLTRAARRRKLGVSKVYRNHQIITGGGRVVGGFAGHLTSLASDEADRAALSIPRVRGLLTRAGIPIPEGSWFAPEDVEAGAAWFSELGAEAVVKPAFSQDGAGVTRHVRDGETFRAAWENAVSRRGEAVGADSAVVVERHHSGLDLRVFVVGEELVAAMARVPLFCLGDGRRTVRELASEAAARREAHPRLGTHAHDALAHAEASGIPLDEISEDGRPYLLGEDVAAPAGGVTVDVTGALGEELQTLAVDAAWAVPGCKAAGVDLLVQGLESVGEAVVLDVDARAGIAAHQYPWIGRRRAVADAIVQQMAATTRG
ncbi:hypothetical protein [Nesterenkonia halobia]|uniref:ATP-grasp domain-containing protein n=1 Tax=Nesterenkonia halobia TaxID=37922 RepID=A0ABP6RFR4_9MICC